MATGENGLKRARECVDRHAGLRPASRYASLRRTVRDETIRLRRNSRVVVAGLAGLVGIRAGVMPVDRVALMLEPSLLFLRGRLLWRDERAALSQVLALFTLFGWRWLSGFERREPGTHHLLLTPKSGEADALADLRACGILVAGGGFHDVAGSVPDRYEPPHSTLPTGDNSSMTWA